LTYGLTSSPQIVTLTNASAGPITFSHPPSVSSAFSIGAVSCVSSLASYSSCTIAVTFTPGSDPNANYTGTLTINDNAAGGPHRVDLSGTRLQAVPTVTWNTPAAITFGTPLSDTQLNATKSVSIPAHSPIRQPREPYYRWAHRPFPFFLSRGLHSLQHRHKGGQLDG